MISDSDVPAGDEMQVMIPVDRLLVFCPVANDVWWCGITWEMVEDAVRSKTYHERPAPIGCRDPKVHAARIAWLSENGWPDPILIDVSEFNIRNGAWAVTDGNHRLAAAILSDRREILVSPCGDLEMFEEVIGPVWEEKTWEMEP